MFGKIFGSHPFIANLSTATGYEVCLREQALVWLFGCLVSIEPVAAQAIRLSGRVQDYQTHQYLPATWRWSDAANKLIREQTTAPDGFDGLVPINAQFLTIISPRYRTIQLPLHWPKRSLDSIPFRVIIPLVPVDTIRGNQPYFQSEQRPLLLSPKQTGKTFIQFYVHDALTNRPIQAEFCLYFTKQHRKICRTTHTLQTEAFQQDIIAIELTAKGYQPYWGNVVIPASKKQTPSQYHIRLNPTPTIVIVLLPDAVKAADVYFSKLPGGPTYSVTRLGKQQFMAQLTPGLYTIKAEKSARILFQDTLRVTEGLTGYRYMEQQQQAAFSAAYEAVIYFEQSSYELTIAARQQLSQLASILLGSPLKQLHIVGHTDNIGNPSLNKTLSEFRAKTTKAYLVKLGVSEYQLHIEGVGSAQPVASNLTEETRKKNRRVSLMLR